ncbi:MAG: hypothetical protein APR62_07530 [Smithella sp. SDB]|nr:MAG: hypothetical protein APR62_07530 [Smithella sp. SDB]
MQIMIKLLKLVLINILVFLGVLILLNLAVISVYKLYFLINLPDHRRELPNYKNISWACTHFKEFGELRSEYRSYVGWRRFPYKGQTINIDKQGIRITPQSESATEKSPLVVFTGGSAMWGTGADDANTIPALFAKIAQGRYRVINLADSGYTAFQGYLFLKLQMINGLKPDIVVSYDGVNDATILQPGLRPFGHQRDEQIREAMSGKDTLSFSNIFLYSLKYAFYKYKNYKKDTVIKANNSNEPSPERIEQTAKALLEGWLSTKDLAEKQGADFIGILQPNPAMGKPNLTYLKLNKDLLNYDKLLYPAVLKLLQTPKYKDLANKVIILTDIFDSKEPIYIDEYHVSPNGNKIVAQKIYDYIINSVDSR